MIRSLLNTFICMAMNSAASHAASSKISNSSNAHFGSASASGQHHPYLPWTVPMALPSHYQGLFPFKAKEGEYTKRKNEEL
jgi:hypothetical protein